MTKKQIQKYLENREMNGSQRLEKQGGGQYLENFLVEFSEHIRNEAINELVGVLRKQKRI